VTVLTPMRPEAFEAYQQSSSAAYAVDKVAAGSWPAEGAVARALADLRNSLPQGPATPDKHLFDIRVAEGGGVVGVL